MAIGMILLGAAAIWMGILAYTGRWQAWARRNGFAHCGGFAALYFGGALISTGLLMVAPRALPPEVLFFTGVPLLWCSIVGFWWLPSFLLPGWFRRGREERRRTERVFRDVRVEARLLKRKRNRPR